MKRHFVLSLVLMTVFLIVFVPGDVVSAQEPAPPDDDVNAIAEQLYCPVCENVPLDACETDACIQWRDLIRDKLSAGWTDDQIKDHFVELYGVRVLAVPPARGFNITVYLVPGSLVLVLFVLAVRRVLRNQSAPVMDTDAASSEVASDRPPQPADSYRAQLEADLQRLSQPSNQDEDQG